VTEEVEEEFVCNSEEEGKIEQVVELVNPITFNSQTSATLEAKVPLEIEQN
jgi:hypothetical protein